jgi:hypothetical protein
MSESDLGRLLADRQLARPRRERGCPPAEDLIAAAAGELPQLSHQTLVAHLSGCPDCAAEYSLATELRDWSRQIDATGGTVNSTVGGTVRGAPDAARRFSGASRIWLPVAAGLLVAALGVAIFVQLRRDARTEELRGTSTADWIVVPRDQSLLDEPPARLEWPEVPGADSYEVELFDDESRPLWKSAELRATSLELPAGLALPAGRTYYWRVAARLGIVEERSPLFSFRLAP